MEYTNSVRGVARFAEVKPRDVRQAIKFGEIETRDDKGDWMEIQSVLKWVRLNRAWQRFNAASDWGYQSAPHNAPPDLESRGN